MCREGFFNSLLGQAVNPTPGHSHRQVIRGRQNG